MGSAIECCEEATSTRYCLVPYRRAGPLLTKEGDSRTIYYTFYPCECRKNQKVCPGFSEWSASRILLARQTLRSFVVILIKNEALYFFPKKEHGN